MVVSAPKNNVQVLTVASRAYLATQRRLCISRGVHWFKLTPTGRLTVDAVKNYIEACDDISSYLISPPDSHGVRHVKIVRK